MPINWKSLWRVQGEKNPFRKLTDEQVYEIRRRIDAGEEAKDVAKDMPVSVAIVQKIGARTRWKHLEERT